MGTFYFDESIHDRAGFILGAYVYLENDPRGQIEDEYRNVGLKPYIDEYKSSAKMVGDQKMAALRHGLKGVLHYSRIGLVITPAMDRGSLGKHAIGGLKKILERNKFSHIRHEIYLDQGIFSKISKKELENIKMDLPKCTIHVEQNSKIVLGIQLADLAAHSCSIMLLEHMGIVTKKVKAGESSGYDPGLDIEIGFEIWATIRYNFFQGKVPYDGKKLEEPSIEDFTANVSEYGLYISETCDEKLRTSASERFGSNYMGCIH